MSALTIECPRDAGLYAVLDTTSAGEVFVRVCRRAGWRPARAGEPGGPITRLLGEMTVDAPLHLVCDRVHAMLLDLHRGEVR